MEQEISPASSAFLSRCSWFPGPIWKFYGWNKQIKSLHPYPMTCWCSFHSLVKACLGNITDAERILVCFIRNFISVQLNVWDRKSEKTDETNKSSHCIRIQWLADPHLILSLRLLEETLRMQREFLFVSSVISDRSAKKTLDKLV